MKKSMKYIAGILVCITVMMLLASTAYAYPALNTEEECTLTINYSYDETALPDVEFYLYKVASADKNCHMTLVDKLSKYDIKVEYNEQKDWDNSAEKLMESIKKDGLKPDYTGTTDKDGKTKLGHLTPGLYFFYGESTIVGEKECSPQYAIVMVPEFDEETSEWGCEVNVFPKCGITDYEPYKVIVKWDDGDSKQRPKQVKPSILDGKTTYNEPTLNADNKWTYTWDVLLEDEADHTWTVNEEKVSGYTATVERKGRTFTITYKPDEEKKLPQTGLLWWPVPVLACTGLTFILAGTICKKARKNEE